MIVSPDEDTQPVKTHQGSSKRIWLVWGFLSLFILGLSGMAGALAGFQSVQPELSQTATQQLKVTLQEQYQLALNDIQAKRYELARQRFTYILNLDSDYPGANEELAAVLGILNATATPTITLSPTPTTFITLTPTLDLRPQEERINQAQDFARENDWSAIIDLLLTLRKDDPTYQVTAVDDFLYLALRQRGINKILKGNDLQGGTYDLALAENFGPLDIEASVARNLARLYMFGSSFWEAYPEKAVLYFSQVAAAAPYLRDGSGWTAIERYRGALIQYGDQFARNGDWCSALNQYQIAAGIRADDDLYKQINDAAQGCNPDTPTPSDTITPTWTPTTTPTFSLPTDTPPVPTDTPPVPPTDTSAPPTDTPEPPATPTPTDTPVP
jgi:hypothetical protein